jgi:hypothetical protein
MRDKLNTDFRFDAKVPHFWANDLVIYNRLLSERRDGMDETLAKLNLVATKTWYAGHHIRNAIGPAYTALGGTGVLIHGNISLAPDEKHNRIIDIRRRVFEASKKFCERPLIKRLRRAITLERNIEFEVVVPGETNARFGITVPGRSAEPPVVPPEAPGQPTVSKKRMTVKEANAKAMKLAHKLRMGFFALSKRQQAEQIGCRWKT